MWNLLMKTLKAMSLDESTLRGGVDRAESQFQVRSGKG